MGLRELSTTCAIPQTTLTSPSGLVRYVNGKNFKEELLALIPLKTTSDIIFRKLEELFKKHHLSVDKINLIFTDDASAMVGKNGSGGHNY